jgi:hypothetical protein
MKQFCSECYGEIELGTVLVAQVLALAEGSTAALAAKAPIQKFCLGCAWELPAELKERFNGKVDEKLLALVSDLNNFLYNDDDRGMENVISYLRDGVNLYFGYDVHEKQFNEGELIQFRLLTQEEAAQIPDGSIVVLENIKNHVFVTLKGAAFTVEHENVNIKHN